MLRFRRVHETGTDALVTQHSDGWRVQINLREPSHNPTTISGFLSPTAERAKELADREVLKHSHVCNGSCTDWMIF